MPEARIISYLGLALVIYLIAGLHSLEGDLDTVGLSIASIAVAIAALGPFWTQRRPGVVGSRRITALCLCAAIALVGIVKPHTRSLSVLGVHFGALCGFGSIVLDLALSVPKEVGRIVQRPLFRAFPYLLGAVATAIGLAAVAPTVAPFGKPWLFSYWWVLVPPVFAALAVLFALGLRLIPFRFASSPEQMASNSWAVQSLIPAAFVIVLFGALWIVGLVQLDAWWCRGAIAMVAAVAVVGHILLADGRYRLRAAQFARFATGSLCALAPIAAAVALLPPVMALEPLSLALGIAAIVLAYSLLYWGLWPLVWRLVAPAGGRLLDAVNRCIGRMASASSFEEIAHAVLMPLREASGSPSAEPLLYIFNPQRELHLDAAGQPHSASRPMSGPLNDYLAQNRGEIVLRDPLEASIVRQPPLRPLVEVLVSLDALCVLPLVAGDNLEGALVIPKGVRKNSITLEELEALRRLSRHVVGLVVVLSAQARADQRANDLSSAHAQAAARVVSLEEELTTLRAEARLLKAGRATEALTQPQVAYSKSMRELLNRISEVASSSSHALLVSETGTSLESLAYLLHVRSKRAGRAFVIGDCASASAEECGRALFGQKQKDGDFPGWLRLAEGGSLLLLDLPALPCEVQRTLGWALATRQAQAIDGDAPYSLNASIIATSRSEIGALVAAGAFDAELAKRLEPGVVRVPRLRDRLEDLSSLVLLELNRASRVLGRESIGIEAEALEILQGHTWPGNLDELRLVIERAVAKARAARVSSSDLPALGPGVAAKTETLELFEGTFDDIERRILEQAIANAGGNKSQAARMLGLKRTTFLDKLKRYRLDDDKTPTSE